ncbi:TetR/AcrR family transcriptional regulator [Streptomyces sp. B93]|uniref:TetR/AcrR family transcriptional regulator n=1 Tax=Streptomyces sp. B93 TaxID=2824875 RepID=UPI001B36E6B2|nr:TetR/AcrR family transcriptional regulator [Streptomyces sp. B93]MBQ1093173.1 TetR/AcrR family transcriptional regulator [Streptomyces sp. B93]
MGEQVDDHGLLGGPLPGGPAPSDEEQLLWDVAAAMRELGPRASMAQIAREAGLAPAALYRRFPTPDLLHSRLAEVFQDRLLAHARHTLDLPVDRQLEYFLHTVGLHLALSHSILPHPFGDMATPEQRERIYAFTARLLEQGKQAGVLAADVALSDIAAVVWGLRGVVAVTDGIAPDAWERHLDVAVAGLKNPGLTFTRPPLDTEHLDRVIHRPSRGPG